MRVLLVEDNAADARLVSRMLEETDAAGVDLVHVPRLSDALKRIRQERFDAVLLDPGPPDARGLEVLRRVQESMNDHAVVIFSGRHGDDSDQDEASEGADGLRLRNRADGKLLMQALRRAIERKEAERHIEHLAYHDGLTGIANRRLLLDRLAQAIARTQRSRRMLAVLFLDVDGFKAVNDTFGHEAGDQLLESIGVRLARQIRASDTLARFGGDEFVLVLPEISSPEDARRFTSKLRSALAAPFVFGGRRNAVSVSIGFSLFPIDGTTPEELLRSADAAMYDAKRESGSGRHDDLTPESVDRLTLGDDLRRAAVAGGFELRFRPRIDVRTGAPSALEAVLRWPHATRGLLPPHQFMPLAEAMGLSATIRSWVLVEAGNRARAWNRYRSGRTIPVSVRLWGRGVAHPEFVRHVERALESARLPANLLELSVSADAILHDEETAGDVLLRLSSSGIRIAIDDFGSGRLSMRGLKRLPIGALTMGPLLVGGVTTDPGDEAVARAIVTLARGLGLGVVARGVETASQVTKLIDLGCTDMQGGYFGPPCSAAETTSVLRRPVRRPVDR